MKTNLTIKGDRFLINGRPTYSEIMGGDPAAHGLLMNARFIQGIFDDKADPSRFARFGAGAWDAEQNTDGLIAALPAWHAHGLRAFTVGFQGGGPCFTYGNNTVENNPYSPDGLRMDERYLARMKRLLLAADEIGMAVIVSLFYQGQIRFLQDDEAVQNAVGTAAGWLWESGFTNTVIEIANEADSPEYRAFPIFSDSGICALMETARRRSGGMPVGCSLSGGRFSTAIAEASDVILIHGNATTRQQYFRLIQKAKAVAPARPVVCNEDSPAVSQLPVALRTGTSWGYYNDLSKQEPPADWGITPGEDAFFARRMAMGADIEVQALPEEEQFYFRGLEPEMTDQGKRWVGLAALYPERIDRVEFYRNGEHIDMAYDDPFAVNWGCNWHQGGIGNIQGVACWKAEVHLTDGQIKIYEKQIHD